jgi:L-glyceraldehyde 3-phosphate reductase
MSYIAAAERYEGKMQYRRSGRWGLDLPVLSLGYWHNFGDERPFEVQRAIARRAFDLGVTHHDLANNYGPPYGSAEINFGRLMREDLGPYRDEMVISTKAGWDMWPGPYGQGYSHRFDPDTPLEETMGALDIAVRQGKALYVGVSSYDAERTREAKEILDDLGTPLLIHQPSYSMLNRWIEDEGLLDTAAELGVGVIGFTALAQGLLTNRYLDGVPDDSRAARGETFDRSWLNDEMLSRLRALNEIAGRRGQTLAQLALAWGLRDERVTSLVIGASSVEQLEQNVDALDNLPLSAEELEEIDRHTRADPGVDLWHEARGGTV